MIVFIRSSCAILVLFSFVFAQTDLSGSIGGMTLEKSGNPFIISDNIIIPSGKKLTVNAGCVFLFKPFTGIIIEGSMEVKGIKDDPVIFSSYNNSLYNPKSTESAAPFDWNGIHLKQNARNVFMEHFILEFSVFGIKSQINNPVILYGYFRDNGQFNFTINDVIQPIEKELPYSYDPRVQFIAGDTASVEKKRTIFKPLLISSGTIGLAGLGAMAYFFYSKDQYYSKYKKADEQVERNLYVAKQEEMLKYAGISGVVGGVCLTAAGVTFLVQHFLKDDKEVMSFMPFIGERNGLLLSFRY